MPTAESAKICTRDHASFRNNGVASLAPKNPMPTHKPDKAIGSVNRADVQALCLKLKSPRSKLNIKGHKMATLYKGNADIRLSKGA